MVEEVEDWYNEEEDDSDNEPQAAAAPAYDFNMEPAEDNPKNIITVAGEKNGGKTVTGASFIRKDKRMVIIQFDGKASRVHKYFYKNTERIQIFDGNKYWDTDPRTITETAFKSIEYIKFLLNKFSKMPENERPHYVMIDGFEVMQMIAEFAMRFNNKKKPFEGFKNRNLWKERRGYIKAVHKAACDAALEGVIYTVYMEQITTKIEDGETVEMKSEPKWFDVIKLETDITLRAFKAEKESKENYYVRVISSKIPELMKPGVLFNVTEKPLMMLDMKAFAETEAKKPKSKPKKDTKKSKPEPVKEEPVEEEEEKVEKVEEVEKVKPEPKKKDKQSKKESAEALTDPTNKPEHQAMIKELSEKQAEMDKEIAETDKQLAEKMLRESKTLIFEAINDDFNGQDSVLIEDLKAAVLKTKLLNEEKFDKSLEMLIAMDELDAHRMGYVRFPVDEETASDTPVEDDFADEEKSDDTKSPKSEEDEEDEEEQNEDSDPKEQKTESLDEFDDW